MPQRIFREQSYIGVEGSSFSGKTTLLHDLAILSAGYAGIIEEYCVYAGGNARFRRVPFADEQDAKGNVSDFIAWERKRMNDAALLWARKRPVFFDRTIFSVIALQKLLHDRYPHLPNAYHFSLERFRDAILDGEIALPSKVILMRSGDVETFSERRARGVSVPFFSEHGVRRYLDDYYEDIFSRLYPGRYMVLDSKNGILRRAGLAIRALRFGSLASGSSANQEALNSFFRAS